MERLVMILKDKRVKELERYDEALSYNDYLRAKTIRIRLRLLDELIEESEKE